ncbi:MAG: aminotransferase class I/II-fold pyridoxal phosphate-dependent enzyme [Gemmatimonadetes bacterium]|nr:aminotransferase class I/II-fold pyridoxal phosphate-dependent enzyme [Gemmatimonadota bacterium]
MPSSSLSDRGARAAATPLRIDYDAFREAEADLFHPTTNPSGKIPLNIAENRLSWPELKSRIEAIAAGEEIADWVPGYTSTRGAPAFREALASFFSQHLAGEPMDPQRFVVSAGATGVIEMTALVLAEAGDVAVIPAPCYPVYERDIANVAGMERYDLVTRSAEGGLADATDFTIPDLEAARSEIESAGKRFRMLILTTPNNPTGGILGVDQLEAVADWCVARKIHLVVNEIYGLSLIDTRHPAIASEYVEHRVFTSFAGMIADRDCDYLHLWYALSKDLGISGFRVGMAYSHNEDFLTGYANLNLTHSVSNHTQWLLSHLLADADFMTGYVSRNKDRLTEAYVFVAGALRSMGVSYVPSRGSLFAWINLSEFLEDDSEEGELALWRDLFDTTGVLLTPGVGFGHACHGLFRVVYPCVSHEALAEAMRRLAGFVRGRRAR